MVVRSARCGEGLGRLLVGLYHGQRYATATQPCVSRTSTSTLSVEPIAKVDIPELSFADLRPTYRAVCVDAAGTFLMPSEAVSTVYLRYARPHGCRLTDDEVLQRFRRAYNLPWLEGPLRYVGDARPFWKRIVEHSTGSENPEVSEAIYQYYSRAEAWYITPGAVEALQRLKDAGVLLAVVSNFDTRLKPILQQLGVEGLFDSVIVSAEVYAEKPNPAIFDAAVRALNSAAVTRGTVSIAGAGGALTSPHLRPSSNPYPSHACSDFGPLVPVQPWGFGASAASDYAPLAPEHVVHVGDDRRNDCWGARDAGITAWMWGYDVRSWEEVADRVLHGSQAEEYYDNLRESA